MSGVLDTFKTRVPAIAAHVEAQVVLAAELRGTAETAYAGAFAQAEAGLRDGALLTGEVLARWQDCLTGGDLRPRRGGKPAKAAGRKGKRARRGPTRNAALGAALRSALESFIVSICRPRRRARERQLAGRPGRELAAGRRRRRTGPRRARQARLRIRLRPGVGQRAARGHRRPGGGQSPAFGRSSPDLPLRAARAVSAWQDHLPRLVKAADAQPAARRISLDDESLTLLVLLAMLGEAAPGAHTAADEEQRTSSREPRRLLASVFGPGPLAGFWPAPART